MKLAHCVAQVASFKLKLWGLPRTLSDHCPLLLMEDDRVWGPIPFKFYNFWLSHSNCLNIMRAAWEGNQEEGWAAVRITKKLKCMKEALKMWSKQEFGCLQTKLTKVDENIHSLDIQAESGTLQEVDIIKSKELKAEMWNLNRQIERMWLQKSRVQWHLKGDRNTKYFHVMARSRQNKNSLKSVSIDDQIVEEPHLVKKNVFKHFQKLYSKNWEVRPFFSEIMGHAIDEDMKSSLVAKFSEEEIWNAIRSCDGNNPNFLRKKSGWIQFCMYQEVLGLHES